MFNVIKDNLKILDEQEVCAMSNASYYKALLSPQYLYDMGVTGKDLVCAVIDSGCDTKHPAFKNKIIGGRNFIKEGKGATDFSDLNGHGTHVAGLISSDPYLSFSGGIAPGAKLLICKALGENGSGSFDAIINAINYAVDQKVDVINMSLGGGVDIPELHDAIKRAYNANITICCASGNEARGDKGKIDELCYPGAYREVIEVGAINKRRDPSYFSNSNKFVDCVCYGEGILSAYLNNNYALLDGTSQATPQVSGCVLLLKDWFRKEFGREPHEEELYAALIKCTDRLPEYHRKQTGFGFVDLKKL
jgi:major intracellular serine protease